MATATFTDITLTNGQVIGPQYAVYSSFVIDNLSGEAVYALECTTSAGGYALSTGGITSGSTSIGASGYNDFNQDIPDGVNVTFTFKIYVGSTLDTNATRWGANTLLATASRTVTIKATPSATQIAPSGGAWSQANYSDPALPTQHQQFLDWAFNSDGWLNDYQSAYEIFIRRVDTQATVGTYTGTTAVTSAVVGIANTFKDIMLEWRVRVTNRYGTVSAWTGYSSFGFATPPVSVITTPVNNAALTSGTINIVTSGTTSGGRTITKTELAIYQGTSLVWSKTSTTPLSSGQNLTTTDSSFILPQSGTIPYTLRVKHTDSLGTVSTEVSRNFTVTYPAVPAGNAPSASSANYDSDGYITVTWPNTNVDSSFYAWVVERRDRPLDPYTGAQIGSFGSWAEVGRVYVNGTSFTFQDYSAPSNSYLEYRVKQIAIRDGYQVISTTANAGTGVSAITTGYWLTLLLPVTTGTTSVTTVGGTAVRLYNVTGDQFKKERVRNTYNLIGRGRYVEEGDELGVAGTLTAQIRDSGATNARQKRLDLENFHDASSRFNLRNPFGDSLIVNIGDIDVTRVPGTGKSEFVDVTIPYSEVS
jgi:hypothetical protein